MEKSKNQKWYKSELFMHIAGLSLVIQILVLMTWDFSKINRVLNQAEIAFNYDNYGSSTRVNLEKSSVQMDLEYNWLSQHDTVTVTFKDGLTIIFHSGDRLYRSYYESQHHFFKWTYEVSYNPDGVKVGKAKRMALREIKKAVRLIKDKNDQYQREKKQREKERAES